MNQTRRSVPRTGTIAVGICLLLGLAGLASAQERFGEINGVATDPSGAVQPNVNITVNNEAGGNQ